MQTKKAAQNKDNDLFFISDLYKYSEFNIIVGQFFRVFQLFQLIASAYTLKNIHKTFAILCEYPQNSFRSNTLHRMKIWQIFEFSSLYLEWILYHYGMIFQGFGALNQSGAPKMYLKTSKYYLDTYWKVLGQTHCTQKRSSRFSTDFLFFAFIFGVNLVSLWDDISRFWSTKSVRGTQKCTSKLPNPVWILTGKF